MFTSSVDRVRNSVSSRTAKRAVKTNSATTSDPRAPHVDPNDAKAH